MILSLGTEMTQPNKFEDWDNQKNKFEDLNDRFANLGTGMTQRYKFRDRWWTLLIPIYRMICQYVSTTVPFILLHSTSMRYIKMQWHSKSIWCNRSASRIQSCWYVIPTISNGSICIFQINILLCWFIFSVPHIYNIN